MKRRVGVILLLLVVGAIVNVAVAWGCALREVHTMAWADAFTTSADERTFWNEFSEGFSEPAEIVAAVRESAFGRVVTTARARLPSSFVPAPDLKKDGYTGPPIPQGAKVVEVKREAWVTVLDSGWPLGSLRESKFSAPGIASSKGSWQWRQQAPALPIKPIWPGFVINTVFYAGILWALFAAPFALRRRRRVRRGLCPACAYPVGESPRCTECGKSLPRKVETSTSQQVNSPM